MEPTDKATLSRADMMKVNKKLTRVCEEKYRQKTLRGADNQETAAGQKNPVYYATIA